MGIKQFEDILAWQKAQELAVSIYGLFGTLKDYGFKDQICRASVSVSNNIAEGFERESDVEFVRFLTIARASCGEVRSMVHLAYCLQYINDNQREQMLLTCLETSRLIRGFATYLKANDKIKK